MDKSTQMQAYISTSKLVAFNIHPRQHYVTENQRIMRDEEEIVYIPDSSSKNKTSLGSLKEFLSAGNSTQAPKKNSPKNSLKNFPPCSLSTVSFFVSLFLFFLSFCIPDLPSQRSLLQPTLSATFFCYTPSTATFSSAAPFSVQSFYSLKKQGWFLMATKDVTCGPLG